jgi:5-methylcytosine-specific restriction endonuclease McrA
MPNPTLNEEQRTIAMSIVKDVESQIEALSNGDDDLRFAFLRKIHKELVYLERDSPSKRKRVKRKVWKAQGQVCAECHVPLEFRFSIADRKEAVKGYVPENLEIIHEECNRVRQERQRFA